MLSRVTGKNVGDVKELPINSALGVLATINIAFLGGTAAISKFGTRFFISCTIALKFCTQVENNNTQNRVGRNFQFLPLKIGAPLNFVFALRPMG